MLFHIVNIFVSIALAVVLAVVTGYATHAVVDMVKTDGRSKSAHSILVAVSVIGWIIVAAAVISFAAMILFPEEIFASRVLRFFVNSMVYILLIATFVIGIMMAVVAVKIRSSVDYIKNKSEYTYATNAALVGLIVSGLLAIIFAGSHYYDMKKHHDPGHQRRKSALVGILSGGHGIRVDGIPEMHHKSNLFNDLSSLGLDNALSLLE